MLRCAFYLCPPNEPLLRLPPPLWLPRDPLLWLPPNDPLLLVLLLKEPLLRLPPNDPLLRLLLVILPLREPLMLMLRGLLVLDELMWLLVTLLGVVLLEELPNEPLLVAPL